MACLFRERHHNTNCMRNKLNSKTKERTSNEKNETRNGKTDFEGNEESEGINEKIKITENFHIYKKYETEINRRLNC